MATVTTTLSPLTNAADAVLTDTGFITAVAEFADNVLVAEDGRSLAAVLSAKSWSDLRGIDELQTSFANWAAENGAGAKIWELYLIVLLQDVLSEEDLREAERLSSDLRYVRKIIRAGVGADDASVRDALAPLLPLSVPQSADMPEPLAELESALIARGLAPEEAANAITEFMSRRAGASWGDGNE